jgi:hypothetical protein
MIWRRQVGRLSLELSSKHARILLQGSLIEDIFRRQLPSPGKSSSRNVAFCGLAWMASAQEDTTSGESVGHARSRCQPSKYGTEKSIMMHSRGNHPMVMSCRDLRFPNLHRPLRHSHSGVDHIRWCLAPRQTQGQGGFQPRRLISCIARSLHASLC